MKDDVCREDWLVQKGQRRKHVTLEVMIVEILEDNAPSPFLATKQLRNEQYVIRTDFIFGPGYHIGR